MSDLQTFLATGSEFDYINSYLSTYEDFIAQPSMAYDGTLPIEKRDDGQYEFAFHDVSFSYPGTNIPVLEHVTLSFAVGEKTALVGRNGAGKTTLIKLLCRLYEPTSGYITLNGIDIRKYSYKEYTQAFSVVFQDFHLFSLPLDENIAAGTEIDEAALQSSLAKVGLTDRVQQLPQRPHPPLQQQRLRCRPFRRRGPAHRHRPRPLQGCPVRHPRRADRSPRPDR